MWNHLIDLCQHHTAQNVDLMLHFISIVAAILSWLPHEVGFGSVGANPRLVPPMDFRRVEPRNPLDCQCSGVFLVRKRTAVVTIPGGLRNIRIK